MGIAIGYHTLGFGIVNCVHRSPTGNFFIKDNSFKIKSPPTLKLRRAKVELEGVEPSSKQKTHRVSTCLVLLELSGKSRCKTTNFNLSH